MRHKGVKLPTQLRLNDDDDNLRFFKLLLLFVFEITISNVNLFISFFNLNQIRNLNQSKLLNTFLNSFYYSNMFHLNHALFDL